MSELVERIKTESKAYRYRAVKNGTEEDKVKSTFLVTFLGELENIYHGTSPSDDQVFRLFEKFKKSAQEMKKYGNTQAGHEIELIDSFLPKKLTVVELKDEIDNIIDEKELKGQGGRAIGVVMVELDRSFAGRYDKGTASKIIRESL